jgi:hypothetical protein
MHNNSTYHTHQLYFQPVIGKLMTAMKEEYNENMKQLTTRMQQVKDEMIRQIALNSTEKH